MAGEKQLGNIVYEVEMNVANLIEAQQKVNQRLDQMEGGFNKSSRSASKFEGAMSKVGVAIAAAFTIETAKRLIAIGDEMNTLQARVTRLSPSIDAAKESMKALSAIASQTGNSLADTERLWESLTSSLKETGATNSQILALTSTLQKIGTIGGSSTEEMSNALRQFGQSIAGGTVRAEEFNSILEQMPELARQIASGMGISIGELRKRMLEGKLTATDALNAIQNRSQAVNDEFDKMPVSIDRAKNSLDVAFKNAISDLNQAIGLTSTLAGLMQNVADNLNYYNSNAGDAARMPKLIKQQQELNKEVQDGQRWYETDSNFQERRVSAAFKLKQTEAEIAHIRAKAANDAKTNAGFKPDEAKSDSKETAKLIQNGERRLALSKLEGEARARLQAQYDAADAGLTDEKRVKALEDQYAATYKNTAAQKESKKSSSASSSEIESNTKKLANLRAQSDLTTESIEKRRIEEAGLRAQQSLGSSATQQQLAEAKALGEANEQAAISIQKRKEAEQGQKFAKQEIASTQAKVDPSTGKAIDPLAQVNLQEQQKLEALAKYQELDKQNTALYEQAKIAIQSDAAMQRKQIADDENEHQRQNMSALLGATSDFFGQMAGAIGDYAGESSAAYKTLFAISKGFAIAQASMNLVTAISNAAALPWPANIPAIAFAAAQGANLISQIRGANYGGGRENGGPVSAGNMYRVGEKGKPEIYQAGSGKQYMIPGDNGKVISNKDLGGSGQIQVSIQFNDYSSGAHSYDAQATQNGNNLTVQAFIMDMDQGGQMSQSITRNLQAPRKARE